MAVGFLRSSLAAISLWAISAGVAPAADIDWHDWSQDVFRVARREHRFILLDLGAVWCHWCHVMDATTYRDPDVVRLVRARFLAVRVDQDSRPDLSNRYEEYGWPATVVFDSAGKELVKFAGYVQPPRMASLLQGVIDDPTPGPSAPPEATLPARGGVMSRGLRRELRTLLSARYDKEHKGWGFLKKFLDPDAVELCMALAQEGDKDAEAMARETLDANLVLLDPVWGGAYQYSDGGDWASPHFEKIMSVQAAGLRTYSLAFERWKDQRYLRAATEILRYLRTFLQSPDGSFYVSQDADLVQGEHGGEYFALDDSGRRAKGTPRVDTHEYTRETAVAADALAVYSRVTGDARALEDAKRAGRWIVEMRPLPGGGFRHDAKDASGPYLGDSIAAARAFLSLAEASHDDAWLGRAQDALAFVNRAFRRDGTPGFVSSASSRDFAPRPQRDENALVVRVAAALVRKTGKAEYAQVASAALAYLAVPEVARRFSTATVLLADREASTFPPRRRP